MNTSVYQCSRTCDFDLSGRHSQKCVRVTSVRAFEGSSSTGKLRFPTPEQVASARISDLQPVINYISESVIERFTRSSGPKWSVSLRECVKAPWTSIDVYEAVNAVITELEAAGWSAAIQGGDIGMAAS